MTDTALRTVPNHADDRSLGDRARDAANATIEAAKDHPYAAAGIAAGVAAAVGGAAYAATRLGGDEPHRGSGRK